MSSANVQLAERIEYARRPHARGEALGAARTWAG
jgi:hypothetical protein